MSVDFYFLCIHCRILSGNSGKSFVDILKRLRNILGFYDKFSILLDIDGRRDMCEKQFLSRLQRLVNIAHRISQLLSLFVFVFYRWHNNDDFSVRNYENLDKLPVILVVVEKGKMGITYPKSLR